MCSKLANKIGLIAIVGIVLIFVIPVSLVYLGTLAGFDFSSMSGDLVSLGVFLFILFIALLVLMGYLRRR